MIYPEGLMHRKVNFFAALLIIVIIASIFVFAISVKAQFINPFSGGAPGIGIEIFTPPIKCVPDPCPGPTCGLCIGSCPVCGNLGGICTSLFEIHAVFLSGVNTLYQGLAFCTPQTFPPMGGSFTPGAQCLGQVYGVGPHLLFNFGCSGVSGFF
jgi:hypothetical protein